MKKKMIQRGLLGFPLGIAIGFVITVIISMCIGDGSFYPVTPELIDTMKNELNAVILQNIALSFSRSYLQALQWLPLFGKLIRGALQSKAEFIFPLPVLRCFRLPILRIG